jgi:phosphatidate cytidylyltransferase
MSEMRTRVITGAILAGIFCALLILASWFPLARYILVYLLGAGLVVAAKEYYGSGIVAGDSASSLGAVVKGGIITASVVCLVLFFQVKGYISASQAFCIASVATAGLLALAFCDGKNELLIAQRELALMVPAVMLLIFGGLALIFIAAQVRGAELLFWLIAVVSANDSAAYFVGSEFGKIRLAPALSPKKTVLGSIAGFLCGTILGAVLGRLIGFPGGVIEGAMLGLVTVFFAQLGDLLKSFAKRSYGIKDFGSLFPGHGGVLDRADGYLAAAPIVALYLVSIFS